MYLLLLNASNMFEFFFASVITKNIRQKWQPAAGTLLFRLFSSVLNRAEHSNQTKPNVSLFLAFVVAVRIGFFYLNLTIYTTLPQSTIRQFAARAPLLLIFTNKNIICVAQTARRKERTLRAHHRRRCLIHDEFLRFNWSDRFHRVCGQHDRSSWSLRQFSTQFTWGK